MAKIALNYQSRKYYSTYACEEVGLCLDSSWSAKTVSGQPLIKATIKNSGRFLGNGGYPTIPQWENPRAEDYFQYSLEYDDAQITDPVTDVVACSDIKSIIDACAVDVILGIAGGGGGGEWTQDGALLYPSGINSRVGIGTATILGTDRLVIQGQTNTSATNALRVTDFLGGVLLAVRDDGNIGVNNSTNYGNGVGVVSIDDAATAPTANNASGGILYSEAGALKWRGSAGTVTTIAPA